MIPTDHVTIAIAAALTVTTLAIALSAQWRALKRLWARFTWTPKLTPGIDGEVMMVMGKDGSVLILVEKIAPEQDLNAWFAKFTERWFAWGAEVGVHCDWTSKLGMVRETPDGPEYTVALVRPAEPAIRTADGTGALA